MIKHIKLCISRNTGALFAKKKKKELNCISLFQSKKTRKVPIFESQIFDNP